MDSKDIRRLVPCCACGSSLRRRVNIVGTGRRAKWEYPAMGNVLTGERGQAVAFLCDACIDKNKAPLRAVEFVGDREFRLHLLEALPVFQLEPPPNGSFPRMDRGEHL